MTRTERELLVEQYLEGSMDFAQEENFFIQVALDDELRRTLKSYRIVDEAIRKEREAGTREHAAARYVVAGILTATPPQVQVPEQGRLAKLLKHHVYRRVATVVGATGLVLFGWMGVQQLTDVRDQTADIRQEVSTLREYQQAAEKRQIQSDLPDNGGKETEGRSGKPVSTSGEQQNSDKPRQITAGASHTPARSGRTERAQTSSDKEANPALSSTSTIPPRQLRIDTAQKAPAQQRALEFPTEIKWGKKK